MISFKVGDLISSGRNPTGKPLVGMIVKKHWMINSTHFVVNWCDGRKITYADYTLEKYMTRIFDGWKHFSRKF